ncbi:MAG: lacto-N-biose phosphorylase central domain-containing protein, partial [Lachnospiraceae bacterium]|nr:lacto-N-biose phosphorylase central domain-containing protein [Lachnospiraceae bacterium]
DAKVYWKQVRRALLRQKIDRIGLGGYLHLVQDYPDFCEYMEKVADEFRTIKTFHENGAVYTMPVKVAVLHSWGALRSWTLSGHFHETWMHDLIQVNEALSGLPYEVRFIDFQDVKDGALKDVDVVINAGDAGSAWSGGENWKDAKLVECLTRWVYEGGTFLGIKEPSAVDGFGTRFRMSHVLGVDRDMGERVCHGKWQKEAEQVEGLIPAEAQVKPLSRIYLTDETVQVLKEEDGVPSMTLHKYGKGMGIYLGSFQVNDANTRLLSSLIQYGAGQSLTPMYQTDNLYTECAYYPGSHKLVMINNSGQPQTASVQTEQGTVTGQMEPYETIMITVQ